MGQGRQRKLATFALFIADAFFLWMFFSAEGLELAGQTGQVAVGSGIDPVRFAAEFSASWRHGMAGGWPLYMPGFFVTAVAIWLWSEGRSILHLMFHATAIIVTATLAALILSPVGASLVAGAFEQQTGLHVERPLPGTTIAGVISGLYTLLTWQTFIGSGRCALTEMSFKPYIPAVILTLGLGLVRPMLVDDFVSLWSRRVFEKNPAAIVSLLLIPILATFLLRIHFRQKLVQDVRSSNAPARN
jgi:hypothetical protein